MWYSNAYRRHLCDMHIADWDDSFLSKFSPEEYVENLKRGNIQNAMLYFQSHAGLCYYPTESGIVHRAFLGREDMMRRTVDLCHQNGITVTGYYSLNYNTAEHDRHPAWRMVQANGRSRRENGGSTDNAEVRAFASTNDGRYGLLCPNHPEYRAFVYRQIDEMISYFDVEGMFFDMPFWPHTCFCQKCRERWEREVGTSFPMSEPKDGSEVHRMLMRKKYEWMGEWIQSVTDHVKSIDPAVSVEHNFAEGIAGASNNGCAEAVSAAGDFVGGDLYGGILNHSLACKFYKNITKSQPFDYMFSRCKPALCAHTLTKTEDEMLTEVLLTTAHHGATMVIDAIDPVGTQDKRVYERIGRVFEKESAYEPYLHGKMAEDVGLYYGIKSRFGKSLCGFDSKDGCIGASKTLIASHIPFGVTGGFHTLDGYRALVIPMVSAQEADSERILQYLEAGGNAYISGARDAALIEALTGGGSVCGYSEESNVYIAPTKENEGIFGGFNAVYPLPFDARAPLLKNVRSGTVLATLKLPYTKPQEIDFASIHSDPPGIATAYPTVIEGRYGQGRFIWSALPIEAIDMEEYRVVLINCVRRLLGDAPFSFTSTAPEDVEITLFEDTNEWFVNVTHLDERARMSDVAPFSLAVKGEAFAVERLPDGASVPFDVKDGYTHFRTETFHVFDMYRLIK
ncbi:MAG: family 10 glycosylhydrolase [Clostridia bacterium]|nr:family 10 glycosylhydrolase [Clostridia bacterium]